jgi:hypothetical protein
MNVYIVDNPAKLVFEQGVWIHYKPSEFKAAEQTLGTIIERYKEEGTDTSPLEYIIECLVTREHPQ